MRASSETMREAVNEAAASDFFKGCRELVDARLAELVPGEDEEPFSVHSAIRWSLFAGGKRFRPALLLATGSALGAGKRALLDTACALEMIHTYSLIHDDLPAMDDDDLRRGRPTCHVRFGEATAVLAGDALQTLAFKAIAEDRNLSADVRVRVIAEIAKAAGTPCGMVAGQAYDLAAESSIVNAEGLERIHSHKTGALIVAAARSGAMIADAQDEQLEAITLYAARLGLLFQITDDLLDVTATAEDLGKTPGKDARASKATYPALYGLEAAHTSARAVSKEACAALDSFGDSASLLRSIALFILNRRA